MMYRILHIPTGRYYWKSFDSEKDWLTYFKNEVSWFNKISVTTADYTIDDKSDLMFIFNHPTLAVTRLEHFEPIEVDNV